MRWMLMVVVVLVLLAGCGDADRSPSYTTLEAAARVSSTQLHVTNRSSRDWHGCTVEINSPGFRSGYSTGPLSIPAGETIRGGLATFTKGGERFNPTTHVVETVTVLCRNPDGIWSGRFQ